MHYVLLCQSHSCDIHVCEHIIIINKEESLCICLFVCLEQPEDMLCPELEEIETKIKQTGLCFKIFPSLII